MNDNDIAKALKREADDVGMRYSHLAQKSNIEYQRLMRIFNQGASMSGTELLRICAALRLDPQSLLRNTA